jgi:hypothetical protein
MLTFQALANSRFFRHDYGVNISCRSHVLQADLFFKTVQHIIVKVLMTPWQSIVVVTCKSVSLSFESYKLCAVMWHGIHSTSLRSWHAKVKEDFILQTFHLNIPHVSIFMCFFFLRFALYLCIICSLSLSFCFSTVTFSRSRKNL